MPSQAKPVFDVIAETRRDKGLSQDELAARLRAASGNSGITREDVSRWERGKRIPGPYWRSWLSQVLDTCPQELRAAAALARRYRRHA